MVTIGKYSFGSMPDWSSWSKINIYDCSFEILVDMMSLLEFLSIGSTKSLYDMIKKIRLGSPGVYYGMREARVAASFQHIFYSRFDGN